MIKWTIELSQSTINFSLCTTIKGQALADFITELTGSVTPEAPSLISEKGKELPKETEELSRMDLHP